jgi:3-methylcrotonyl-CoA carboxylase beta subunit
LSKTVRNQAVVKRAFSSFAQA